jgi:DNA-binding NtrC family response regulator
MKAPIRIVALADDGVARDTLVNRLQASGLDAGTIETWDSLVAATAAGDAAAVVIVPAGAGAKTSENGGILSLYLARPWKGDASELAQALERILTPPAPLALNLPLREVERRHIEEALKATGGNKSRAARVLGMSRRALYRRIEKFGLARIAA